MQVEGILYNVVLKAVHVETAVDHGNEKRMLFRDGNQRSRHIPKGLGRHDSDNVQTTPPMESFFCSLFVDAIQMTAKTEAKSMLTDGDNRRSNRNVDCYDCRLFRFTLFTVRSRIFQSCIGYDVTIKNRTGSPESDNLLNIVVSRISLVTLELSASDVQRCTSDRKILVGRSETSLPTSSLRLNRAVPVPHGHKGHAALSAHELVSRTISSPDTVRSSFRPE